MGQPETKPGREWLKEDLHSSDCPLSQYQVACVRVLEIERNILFTRTSLTFFFHNV